MSETLDNRDAEPAPEPPQGPKPEPPAADGPEPAVAPEAAAVAETVAGAKTVPEPETVPEAEAAPGPEAGAADGEDAPQGPPAPDDESGTGGAGGNTSAEGEAEAHAPTERQRPRPRYGVIGGVGVLLAAVVGGVGFTVVTVQGADRDAGRPVWHLPRTTADAEAKTAAPTGLAATLVPYDDEWTRGPDLTRFGSDTQLSGAEATALRKESLRDLPRTQRKRMERLIDEQHIKGMAMRSYLLDRSDYDDTHSAGVSIVLSQMEDQAAVKEISTFQNRFMDALGVFRKGPAVKGYKNAKCFMPPKDAKEKLDAMVCSAYQGDVLVTLTAGGPKTLATGEIAKLLETQLHRIKEPGKSV